jgi:DinB superfamily
MEKINSQQLIVQLQTDVKSIVKQVLEEFTPLSEAQLNQKEHAAKWSILECFQHLNLYSRYYLHAIELAIQKEKTAKSQPFVALKSTWIGKLSIQSMHPKNTKKQKTFKHMNPVNSKLDKSVLDEFLVHQQKLQNLVGAAGLIDLNSGKVPVEFFKLLKMNIGEALQFIVVHEQRHLLQAKTVKSTLKKLASPVLSI